MENNHKYGFKSRKDYEEEQKRKNSKYDFEVSYEIKKEKKNLCQSMPRKIKSYK